MDIWTEERYVITNYMYDNVCFFARTQRKYLIIMITTCSINSAEYRSIKS